MLFSSIFSSTIWFPTTPLFPLLIPFTLLSVFYAPRNPSQLFANLSLKSIRKPSLIQKRSKAEKAEDEFRIRGRENTFQTTFGFARPFSFNMFLLQRNTFQTIFGFIRPFHPFFPYKLYVCLCVFIFYKLLIIIRKN